MDEDGVVTGAEVVCRNHSCEGSCGPWWRRTAKEIKAAAEEIKAAAEKIKAAAEAIKAYQC